ncbi:flagellar hook protein FlgE [Sphaerotilus sp.]|uniref:flagellar hook protein FlgE n=1 Tax=Sphaerotilus sp. TaxID=2093942 RepID=UPI002ACDD148|nr:flagellar hook protein FlgE [Sphaerotilus sp.]MDZ7856348.1 flagellar hook protein FlgE [Sphaerotilus sp.]
MNFQQGLSGLNATSKNMEVIGNNIANAGTYGAKAGRAEFADMYANSIGTTNNNNIGIGVQVAAVTQQFSQGSVVSTSNMMDVAINGRGFFQLKEPAGGLVYSRNGQFQVDSTGYIVNSQNQRLQGYQADKEGVIETGVKSDLQLSMSGIAPQATDKINMTFNLDSRGKVTKPTTGTIAFDDPSTYNNATSVQVFDAKGQPAEVTYYFQKAATDTWNVYAALGDKSLNETAGVPQPMLENLTFNSSGLMPSLASGPLERFTLPDIPATDNNALISGIKIDFTDSTQFGATFSVTDLNQNGYAPGQFASLNIGEDGIISARYTNGLTQPSGQLEIATFRNPQALSSLGGNAWVGTLQAGDPITGTPGSGTLGVLQSGALEESNVDLTGELVNMMTAQRFYQANAQTIKTQDSMLQTLVSMR